MGDQPVDDGGVRRTSAPSATPFTKRVHVMKILIVDENRTMRRITRHLLRQLGYEDVVEVSDGEAALAAMRAQRIDLVIADANTEPMSGLELLQWVRYDAGLKDTPFVMLVMDDRSEKIISIREAGVSAYLVRPFTADTLKQTLDYFV
ncbi:response regulator [Xanthomonas sacchari]|uniref:response regulator n=2 Tax=Xanthomonas TaxID=338 RepID=UPI00225DE70F|nr:response regulator [Xanthomonas sacchari]